MGFLAKTKFKWREPHDIVRERDISEAKNWKWWHAIATVVISTGFGMLIWWGAALNPKKSPPSMEVALLLAMGLGIFLGYVAPWLSRRGPRGIKLTDKGIMIFRAGHIHVIPWKHIVSFRIEEYRHHPMLCFERKKGTVVSIAVEESIKIDEVREFLIETGIELSSPDQ
jgi:hypothetical protein